MLKNTTKCSLMAKCEDKYIDHISYMKFWMFFQELGLLYENSFGSIKNCIMLILLENIKHSGRPRLVINEKSIAEVKNLLT